jgi:HEAT repeat protein
MRKVDKTGLMIAVLLLSGCFQAEAPRPAAPPAGGLETREPQAQVRARAEVAEEEIPPAVTVLAATLRENADPGARRDAVYEIADAGIEGDTGFVGQALADPDLVVRHAAIEALTGFDAETAVSYLALALNDDDPRIRQDATEALGHIGSASARQALQQAAIDMDPNVREAAAQMLDEPERASR